MSQQSEVCTKASLIPLEEVYELLSRSHWSADRTQDGLACAIQNSLPFGIFVDDHLAAFARVISDYATFAYITDVFVHESYRGRGFARSLIQAILNHPKLVDVNCWRLKTTFAHRLYAQFGFALPEHPERDMEFRRNSLAARADS